MIPIDTVCKHRLFSYRHSIGDQGLERSKANLLQGTLDLLILKAIGDDEFHGLGIARRIE